MLRTGHEGRRVKSADDRSRIDGITACGPPARILGKAGSGERITEVALTDNLALDLAVAGPEPSIVTGTTRPDDPALPVFRLWSNLVLRFALFLTEPRDALPRSADAARTEYSEVSPESLSEEQPRVGEEGVTSLLGAADGKGTLHDGDGECRDACGTVVVDAVHCAMTSHRRTPHPMQMGTTGIRR
ncbi:hypothetical protein [Streptomyces tendae]|uniref:hypothetical protein n=1 Tax=Streptomyces tendae TaxID=1932 RepID=UPI0036AD866A